MILAHVNGLFTYLRMKIATVVRWWIGVVLLSFGCFANAAPVWLGYSDVSPRGFTVTVQSDEAVLSATLRVFTDVNATSEVTSALSLKSPTENVSAFHAQGFSSFRVGDAALESSYYAQVEVLTGSGTYFLPGTAGALEEVQTVRALQSITPDDQLSLNALVSFDLAATTANSHSAVSLQTAGMAYPLLQLSDRPSAYFDLNNAIDVTGDRLELPAGELVALNQYFGVNCASENALTRYRRAIAAVPSGSAQPVVPLEACFFADVDCNLTVNNVDVEQTRQRVFQTALDCGFNPDLDIVSDDTIDVLDFQSVLNRLGQSEPFE